MNKFIIYGIALLTLLSCDKERVHIEGRIIGAESSIILLERSQGAEPMVIDTVTLSDEGRFKISFEAVERDPALYNIVSGGERIPLFLANGDNVTISSIGSISSGYRVEGSEESEILRQFYQPYLRGMSSLDAVANEYASTELSEDERRDLARQYTKEYQSIKQQQLRFIIENQSSLAAVYALFQRLPGDQYLFNGDNDIIYFRTVADALEQSYPESSYLKSLRSAIATMEASINLKNRVASSSYPELELPDMYGNKITLSSLNGKVILLEFWSSELGNSNSHNAELKEIYAKYKDRGLEIYQVGIDNSKSRWISTVQDQRLPWISVNDMRGSASPSLGLYNVTKLPTNFLIDSSGTVIMRDVAGEELESQLDTIFNN